MKKRINVYKRQAGILIMCLLQINRLSEDEDTAEHRKS